MNKTSNILILTGVAIVFILIIGFFLKMKSHVIPNDAIVSPISKELHEIWAEKLGIVDLKVISAELDSLTANVLNLGGNSQYILDPFTKKIKVSSYSSLVSQVESNQNSGSLSLGRLPEMTFTIGVKDKSELTINVGHGVKMHTADKVVVDNLQLNLSEGTTAKLDLDVHKMTLAKSVNSTCELKGTFEKLTIN